jgi:hypothetical protein
MAELMTSELKRLNYLTSEIDAAYHEAARKLGLSDSTMMVLYAACNNGGPAKRHLQNIRHKQADDKFCAAKAGSRRADLPGSRQWQAKKSMPDKKRHGLLRKRSGKACKAGK